MLKLCQLFFCVIPFMPILGFKTGLSGVHTYKISERIKIKPFDNFDLKQRFSLDKPLTPKIKIPFQTNIRANYFSTGSLDFYIGFNKPVSKQKSPKLLAETKPFWESFTSKVTSQSAAFGLSMTF